VEENENIDYLGYGGLPSTLIPKCSATGLYRLPIKKPAGTGGFFIQAGNPE
jgi:hypothetical protein